MYRPNLSCRSRYFVGASMGQPLSRWSMVSVCLSHALHFGLAPSSNILAWKFDVGKVWSCAAMMKLSVSDIRPGEASHWWVSEEFTSRSLARIGYLLWRGLSFHPSFCSLIFLVFSAVLICFAFSVDAEFSEMLSVLRLISFKCFFASLVVDYIRLFSSCFFTRLSIQSFVLFK